MNSSVARYFPRLGTDVAASRLPDALSPSKTDSAVGRGESADELSDEVLISKIRAENQEALAFLFRRYARLVRSLSLRILGDESEADDLLQDVFLFIHRKAGVFDPSK